MALGAGRRVRNISQQSIIFIERHQTYLLSRKLSASSLNVEINSFHVLLFDITGRKRNGTSCEKILRNFLSGITRYMTSMMDHKILVNAGLVHPRRRPADDFLGNETSSAP